MAKPETVWYIKPLDAFTNEVISRELPEESFQREVYDDLNKPHNLWEAGSFSIVNFVLRSAREQNLKFSLFVRRGKDRIRSANFLKRR